LGTYIGNPDAETDGAVIEAASALALAGCNVFDTAPNYRDGRAECCVGKALTALRQKGIGREQIFISTKVGIVPESLLRPLADGSLLPGYQIETLPTGQCFSPAYIRWQVEQSRFRLGIETIDCVFLHNVEEARCVRPDGFPYLLSHAIETLEALVARRAVRWYGLATWHGLRVNAEDPCALVLGEVLAGASEIAGNRHGLHCVQLPVGLWAPEAITNHNQPNENGGPETPLVAAANLGLTVFGSAPLCQGELARADLSYVHGLPQLSTAQQLLQFSRSLPGVATVLVGLKERRHVSEALEVAALPRSDLTHISLRDPSVGPRP
jgi:aryl-alcohol dehydrogenase-like predicted oxidoreductase